MGGLEFAGCKVGVCREESLGLQAANSGSGRLFLREKQAVIRRFQSPNSRPKAAEIRKQVIINQLQIGQNSRISPPTGKW